MTTITKKRQLHLTEDQQEYNYIRNLNRDLHMKSKQQYISDATKFMYANYISDPETYFLKKGLWISWSDFLGLETHDSLKELEDGINALENGINCCDETYADAVIIDEIANNLKQGFHHRHHHKHGHPKRKAVHIPIPIQPLPIHQLLQQPIIMKCYCGSKTSPQYLCNPKSNTWNNCPQKLRYVAHFLTNLKYVKNNMYKGLHIYLCKRYFHHFSPKYLVKNKQTGTDIKIEFKLSANEFNELVGLMLSNFINK